MAIGHRHGSLYPEQCRKGTTGLALTGTRTIKQRASELGANEKTLGGRAADRRREPRAGGTARLKPAGPKAGPELAAARRRVKEPGLENDFSRRVTACFAKGLARAAASDVRFSVGRVAPGKPREGDVPPQGVRDARGGQTRLHRLDRAPLQQVAPALIHRLQAPRGPHGRVPGEDGCDAREGEVPGGAVSEILTHFISRRCATADMPSSAVSFIGDVCTPPNSTPHKVMMT